MSGDPDSLKKLEALRAERPEDRKVQVDLARLYLDSGRVDEAVALYVLVAEGHAKAGAPFYAIAGYRRVLRLAPAHPTARERIGELYGSMGFPDEAAGELLAAMEERHAAGDHEAVSRIAAKVDALPRREGLPGSEPA